ncbi:hypothetical protein BDQ17DRAFT_58202 [Cyathus striatus]|nr:hypothetical protein BDQ17DRAFT_58202 [Cyathus striatus]
MPRLESQPRASSLDSRFLKCHRIAVPISSILSPKGLWTNADGRCLDLLPPTGSEEAKKEDTDLKAGQTYKIVFKTKEYFERTNRQSFYPWVEISFVINNPGEHYHIPLLISPHSFTTYRGS